MTLSHHQQQHLTSVKMVPLLALVLLSSVSRSEAGDCVTRAGDPGECTRERDCEDVVRGR